MLVNAGPSQKKKKSKKMNIRTFQRRILGKIYGPINDTVYEYIGLFMNFIKYTTRNF
jgi:hypothetical protein